MNKSKGFTIIELIVVIAIIAVLASIVLVNVTQYINKGKDAAAKGNLSTMMTNAAIYLDDNTKGAGDYDDFQAATNTLYTAPYAALNSAGYATGYVSTCDQTASCASGGPSVNSKWCACVVEKSPSTTTYYCVDSSGNKKEQTVNACAAECLAGVCQ